MRHRHDPARTFQPPELERFREAWTSAGARNIDAFATLAHRYGETHRAYHTPEHIRDCLFTLDATRIRPVRPNELELALFFHDVVYEPLGRDNEARSAALFEELARLAGLSQPVRGRVRELILATDHQHPPSGDAALLCGIDLAVLGGSEPAYERYTTQVRREYTELDDSVFRAGRRAVLAHLLERPRIFAVDELRSRYEARARQNVQREFVQLGQQEAS